MEQELRNSLRRTVNALRELLEDEILEQLEGTFGVLPGGEVRAVEDVPPLQADPDLRRRRDEIVAAIEHEKTNLRGKERQRRAVEQFAREAAFTLLNRLAALKLMERRELVPESVGRGTESEGFRLFRRVVPAVRRARSDDGYRLFLELLFDDVAREVRLLFDRTSPLSHPFPDTAALDEALRLLNDPDLDGAWEEDETLGWIYQYFTPKEERERVRKESSAPRDTYELAIRNQFYTPEYVVRFLAENSLGRLWWEMFPETSVVERDYLVMRPDEAPTEREPKDPRTIRVLDPACGSGHFLHYCFELFQTIYREAYDGHASGVELGEEYPDPAEFERAVPGLILHHNLHGIDIDLRATQLTALSLYLKAKNAHPAAEIHRVNAVHAAPMPGNEKLLEEFLDGLKGRAEGVILAELVGQVWDELDELAGEAGSLLKAEKLIGSRVDELREELRRQGTEGLQLPLADIGELQPRQRRLDLDEVPPEQFWAGLEEQLVRLLEKFALSAEQNGVSRRLFAEDAAHGFGFLDTLMHSYDVVLMNPPFGAASKPSKKYVDRAYPRTKNDVYAAFVERGLELLQPRGLLGAITSRTGFFLTSFQKWREEILLEETDIVCFADLGYGVLDTAMVETAAYVLEKQEGEAER